MGTGPKRTTGPGWPELFWPIESVRQPAAWPLLDRQADRLCAMASDPLHVAAARLGHADPRRMRLAGYPDAMPEIDVCAGIRR